MSNHLNQIVNQILLNIKYTLNNYKSFILILLFLITPIPLGMFFIPFRFAIGLFFMIGVFAPSAILYISLTFNWTKGTLNNNMEITRMSRAYFYVSSFIFFQISVIILTIALILLLQLAAVMHVLIVNWGGSWWEEQYYNPIHLISMPFIYSIFEFTIVMWALLFMMESVINNEKIMYIFLLTVFVIEVMYGGIINNHFTDIYETSYNPETGEYEWMFVYGPNIVTEFMYYPVLILFPLYAPSQHLATFKFTVVLHSEVHNLNWFVWQHAGDNYSLLEDGNYDSVLEKYQAIRWNILWLMPYIHFINLTLIGELAIILKKK